MKRSGTNDDSKDHKKHRESESSHYRSRDDRSRRHRDHERSRRHKSDHYHRSRHHHSSSRHHHESNREKPVKPLSLSEELRKEDGSSDEGEWVVGAESGPMFPDDKDIDEGEEIQPVLHTKDIEVKEEKSLSKLNKLKAEIMKLEMRGNDPSRLEELQTEFKELQKDQLTHNIANVRVLDTRLLPTPRSISSTSREGEPSLQDMVREEIKTRNQGDLLGQKLAQHIGQDASYDNDLEYLDENSEKLSKVKEQPQDSLSHRNKIIEQTRRLSSAIEDCKLCMEDGSGVTVVSIATRAYLCLAPEPAITKGVSVIVPLDHHKNTLECDDDEWEEIRNYMKSLTQMWHDQGRSIIFYENAVSRSMRQHACIFAVPVSHEALDTAPGFFQEAMLAADEEWSEHRKVIDTIKMVKDRGRFAFRTSIAKEAPYFHAWFNINGGLGHIVEDQDKWPKQDLFAREIIGGLLRTDPIIVRKFGKWTSNSASFKYFQHLYSSFDWTKSIE